MDIPVVETHAQPTRLRQAEAAAQFGPCRALSLEGEEDISSVRLRVFVHGARRDCVKKI
jgi:hypothetical protein